MENTKKKLPVSLIILIIILVGLCVMIFFNLRQGFYMFETFQPEEPTTMPASPGYP